MKEIIWGLSTKALISTAGLSTAEKWLLRIQLSEDRENNV